MTIKPNRLHWIIFLILSFLSVTLWYKLSYPSLAFVQLSVDKNKAVKSAEDYLRSKGYDISGYKTAVIFGFDDATNRYLEKTIGFEKLKQFLRKHDFDMFFWIIRLFKEGEKEEFRLTVSAKKKEIISFKHIIEETAHRRGISKQEAQEKVEQFLKASFNFDPGPYTLRNSLQTGYDNRIEFSFTWQKKDVLIPWSPAANSGTGKLVAGATIAGNEILSFSKNTFIVPDPFNRFLEKNFEAGRNLSTAASILYLILFVSCVFIIVQRRNHLAMHTTKKFYIKIACLLFAFNIISYFNNFQGVLFNYPTTVPLDSYLGRNIIQLLKDSLFFAVAILMPSLSGELLRFEMFKNRKEGSFLFYLHSTFFSRKVASSILLGYLTCLIMLGIQSVIINFGKTYLGVWVEHDWMSSFSSAYLPFLAALIIGFKASFTEEIMYRMFAIGWGKKIFKSTVLAVLFSSLVWGFAHSGYPVFPTWFRGIEVACLGTFLAFIYLRYGIITAIIAHYLFDSFWTSAEYLLGQSQPLYFYSSLSLLLLPLALAVVSFFLNRKEQERPLCWYLNKHQKFNLQVLKNFLKSHSDKFKNKTKEEIKEEIASHGWDVAVVEIALEETS